MALIKYIIWFVFLLAILIPVNVGFYRRRPLEEMDKGLCYCINWLGLMVFIMIIFGVLQDYYNIVM